MSDESVTAVLLLSCRDQRGLVAAVSDFVYRNDGNITHADQHTDLEEGVFLQRVEWELAGFAIPREDIEKAFRPIAERFDMAWSLRFSDHVARIAIMASRLPHCLYDLLARWRLGELQAEIPIVVSNHPELRSIAEGFEVAYLHAPIDAEHQEEQEEEIVAAFKAARVDIVVLARYMRIVGERIVGAYPNRVINIHHSFLPAFEGGRPYHHAHERGVKIVGATAHYITGELDKGPIIEQDVVRVSHRDSVADLIRKGREIEKVVLARALDLHLRNRVLVYGNKTVVFD